MPIEAEYIAPDGVQFFYSPLPFFLEQGGVLEALQIAYHSYGQLNEAKDNVIFVCHALTANSDAADWWPGMIGEGCLLDSTHYFIICANVIGSYYGSTSPRFPQSQKEGLYYGQDFPAFTVRDIARAQLLLLEHLGITQLALCIGGSFGGHQALEMGILWGERIRHLALLACSACETAWSIAIHETQRMALETDPTLWEQGRKAGSEGLKTARAIGLIAYRTIATYIRTQSDDNPQKLNDFRASSYVRYQGQKLEMRFHAHCYWHLTKCLDTHHIGRNRAAIEDVLAALTIPTTIIAIKGDMLIPPSEQLFMHQHIPNSRYFELDSPYGHDGFLIEIADITRIMKQTWLCE